jgi:hypothetical protein
MSEPAPTRARGGCFSKLIFLLLLVVAIGLGAALFSAVRPQDLSDLKGRAGGGNQPQRDLKLVLRNALDRGYPVTLTETELNQWLSRTLQCKQGGMLEKWVKLERVWVRLEDGRAEVIMERSVFGRPFTVSMYLQVAKYEDSRGLITDVKPDGGPYHPDFPKPPKGGRFGRLVVPQGFLHLVLPAYKKLAAEFSQETGMAFSDMAQITIESGRLVLNPRGSHDDAGLPVSPF